MLKKESVEEKNIINYNFHRIEVSLDENYNVYSITIHNENLNNKIGDYPIITVEEAKNRLLEQRYWTSACLLYTSREHVLILTNGLEMPLKNGSKASCRREEAHYN